MKTKKLLFHVQIYKVKILHIKTIPETLERRQVVLRRVMQTLLRLQVHSHCWSELLS